MSCIAGPNHQFGHNRVFTWAVVEKVGTTLLRTMKSIPDLADREVADWKVAVIRVKTLIGVFTRK